MPDKTVDFVVRCGTLVSAALALIIIAVPVFGALFVSNFQIPKVIENWGGVIVGFYFGSFLSLVADMIRKRSESSSSSSH